MKGGKGADVHNAADSVDERSSSKGKTVDFSDDEVTSQFFAARRAQEDLCQNLQERKNVWNRRIKKERKCMANTAKPNEELGNFQHISARETPEAVWCYDSSDKTTDNDYTSDRIDSNGVVEIAVKPKVETSSVTTKDGRTVLRSATTLVHRSMDWRSCTLDNLSTRYHKKMSRRHSRMIKDVVQMVAVECLDFR